jgi:putative phosphoserine phosphatase/1-acylglycerol-3-phosphate O-acyltransferase
MPAAAAIFDLDRTLIAGAPTPVLARHLRSAGLIAPSPVGILAELATRLYDQLGQSTLPALPALPVAGERPGRGWGVADVERVAASAAVELELAVMPFAPSLLDEHRRTGRVVVLATATPEPLVAPLARRLGVDHVVATRWRRDDGRYTGELDGPVLRGRSKLDAVRAWAGGHRVALGSSWAYADSYADSLLLAAVGHPVAVNPDPALAAVALLRGWPVRYLDAPEGVVKLLGWELQDWTRPLARPELVPNARFVFSGVEHVPPAGPAILAFNHRSYFDPTALALLAAKVGRPVRGLGKKEVFDAPVVGRLARWAGGIRVERASGSDEPLEEAARALRGGELVMIAPQGTIPRGRAFFDPELKGRWGTARLAAMTGAPVIPVGLWGTEEVWPRSARLPRLDPLHRPTVTVAVGPPVELGHHDVEADTKAIMAAIVALLPDEARRQREPTEAELRRTLPPGYTGDPDAEARRRPGTDA